MKKLTAILKKIFCLPPLWTVLVSVFGFAFVIIVFAFDVQNPVLRYASYLASAYALTVSATGITYIGPAAGRVKKYAADHPIMKRFTGTRLGSRFMTDIRFRAGVSLYQGMIINAAYIVVKLVSGIVYRSVWFVSLAVYYALLAVMRLLIARRVNARDMAAELKRYRLCGFMLLLMNQALAGIVIFMVKNERGFDYPGVLIYAMAAYSFYAVITAAVSIVRTRRHKSPILSASKAISLVAAMVSMLSLETAMISRFGSGDDGAFRVAMTSATGGAVCTAVIGMAIYMIARSGRELKKIKFNKTET